MIVVDHKCPLSPMECCLRHVMGLRPAHHVDDVVMARRLRKIDSGCFGRRSGVEWNRRVVATSGSERAEKGEK